MHKRVLRRTHLLYYLKHWFVVVICYSYDLPLALKSDQSSNGSAKLDALTMSNETDGPDSSVLTDWHVVVREP